MTTTRREFVQRSAAGALALSLGPVAAPGAATAASRLTSAQLSALKRAVRGPVFAPGGKGYAAAARLFNTRYNGIKPPAVVQVASAADVQAVVRWANRYDIALVPRSGGNAYNGASTSSSGVVVDVGALDRIALNASGVATVGPGARLLDVYASLARRGATIPAGSCPNVAIGGHALGGGMGLAGRGLGLTLDRITSITAVTADGRLRTCSASQNRDLFWALRGGGGSFALVTSIALRARRISSASWFRIFYPASERAAALAAFDELVPDGPSDLTGICTLTGTQAIIQGEYLGTQAALEQIIAPLRAIPSARVNIGTSGYFDLMRMWAACSEGASDRQCVDIAPQSFDASSIYVSRKLSGAARSAFVAAADTGATLVCDSYGGKINDVSPSATAFVHRGARFSVQIASYAPIATARRRVHNARAAITDYGNGQAYQNYSDLALGSPLQDYYGENLRRLRQVKREVDPDDRFQVTQGIRA
jgi:FAD/FMN-containing dehydrogenase